MALGGWRMCASSEYLDQRRPVEPEVAGQWVAPSTRDCMELDPEAARVGKSCAGIIL